VFVSNNQKLKGINRYAEKMNLDRSSRHLDAGRVDN
jgi:hypothetical protein